MPGRLAALAAGRPRPSTTPRPISCASSPASRSTGCSRRSTDARPTSVRTCPEPLVADDAATQPGGGGRARRLAHARVPRAARRAHAEGARGAAAPRRVRLPVRRDRGDGRPVTRRVPPAGEPHPPQARPRARRRCAVPTRRASRSSSAHLLATVASGDVDAVMELLAPDVVLLSDGGAASSRGAATGRRCRPRRALRGEPGERLLATGRGAPGAGERRAGRCCSSTAAAPDYVLSFSFTPDGRVRRLYSQLNPEKLRHLR